MNIPATRSGRTQKTPPSDAIFNRLGASYDATRYVYGIPQGHVGAQSQYIAGAVQLRTISAR